MRIAKEKNPASISSAFFFSSVKILSLPGAISRRSRKMILPDVRVSRHFYSVPAFRNVFPFFSILLSGVFSFPRRFSRAKTLVKSLSVSRLTRNLSCQISFPTLSSQSSPIRLPLRQSVIFWPQMKIKLTLFCNTARFFLYKKGGIIT